MSASHTKGPWSVGGSRGLAILSSDGITVGAAHIRPISNAADADAPEANARLIAAAPDMLEALERNITNFKGQRADLDFARAAIAKAKAKGEQS